jgi:hypothetical protein
MNIPLDFMDGINVVSTLQTVHYKKNKVLEIYPQAALTGTPLDVYVSFNSSTFNTTLNITYYCKFQDGNYSAIVLNSTTIKCLSVLSLTTKTFVFDIYAVFNQFKFILNEEKFEFYTISKIKLFSFKRI